MCPLIQNLFVNTILLKYKYKMKDTNWLIIESFELEFKIWHNRNTFFNK